MEEFGFNSEPHRNQIFVDTALSDQGSSLLHTSLCHVLSIVEVFDVAVESLYLGVPFLWWLYPWSFVATFLVAHGSDATSLSSCVSLALGNLVERLSLASDRNQSTAGTQRRQTLCPLRARHGDFI